MTSKTYMGRACRKGHDGLRYISSNACVHCQRAKSIRIYQNLTPDEKRDRIEKQAESGRQWRANNKARHLWHSTKNRALEKGMEHTITPDDIVIPDLCPVFGTPMDRPSVDRFDNNQGYVKDNIRVISNRANMLKNDATIEELEAVLRYMKGEIQC